MANPYKKIGTDPTSGQGNKTLEITAQPHTGREDKVVVFMAQGTGAYTNTQSENNLVVRQAAKGAFISMDAVTGAISSDGGSVTVNGKSNLQTLTLSGVLANKLTSATVNTVSVQTSSLTSGYAVPDDPGKENEYDVSLTFTIESTTDARTLSGTIGEGSVTTIINISQNGILSSLAFSVNNDSSSDHTVTINADGTAFIHPTTGMTLFPVLSVVTNPQTLGWTASGV